MQKDLYDMLGQFDGVGASDKAALGKTFATGSFLGQVFLPKQEATVLAQGQGVPAGYNADGPSQLSRRKARLPSPTVKTAPLQEQSRIIPEAAASSAS